MPYIGYEWMRNYDVILVNSSAGKDSQAMLDFVVEQADAHGVRDRLVVVHADLGRVEWPGTLELAREHAAHYALRFEVVKREGRGDLLAEIRRRGKWPSSTERYCTSYYKRDQVAKLVTRLAREVRARFRNGGLDHQTPKILNCLGFRAEESPRRKKLPPFQGNRRLTTRTKKVDDWLPIHDWTLKQVWARIRGAGTRHHPAYDLGMTRLSCRFCIFAPRSQLIVSAKANPELFAEYVEVERQIGHKFRMELSLVELDEAIKAGEQPACDDGNWNM